MDFIASVNVAEILRPKNHNLYLLTFIYIKGGILWQ